MVPHLFCATHDALFSTLPFTHRWRLLLLQPINILAILLTSPFWLFNNRSSVLYVPTRSGKKRCLVYQPPRRHTTGKGETEDLRPLHIDIHGGGFIGGFPEQGARWCSLLSDRTGAVVVSCSYRFAPRYTFPAAHDDIDDVVSWILSHAAELNADPNLLTVGGSSVGGNLALSAAQYLAGQSQAHPSQTAQSYIARAFVGFCPPVNFRLKPQEKPIPPNFPAKDPLSFLVPLFDAYAGSNRTRDWDNPRLNTFVADKGTLPKDMLFVVAGIDILMHEQLAFLERIKEEMGVEGETDRRVEARVWDKGFHGWMELPKMILEKERMEAFEISLKSIRRVHWRYGFDLDKVV
ncbi:alpha/beta-hydrolase [Lentithecium fluviatile CBS 122367]|uniref:Alpha/beta-hydrolase n=1 Tax=Lentithecium fluviatile CBS 122367 TaxID=1168545 RepID=A0A6G1JBX7_9PLEO|nr:alpha/beta-hydrolase [Lentithecium fluviatile CBS 122367]